MFDDLNINKGFESMIPRSPEGEEVTNQEVIHHHFSITLFGNVFALTFTVTRS